MYRNLKSNLRVVSLSVFTLSLLLSFPCRSVYANSLTLDDYNRFRPITLRMRAIGSDLSNFMINPPMPRGSSQDAIKSAVRTQDCIIRLAGTFSSVESDFNALSTLVGLSAKMVAKEDELLLLQFVKLQASGFIEGLVPYRRMLRNTTEMKCSDDGATVAKGQEISRAFDDAEKLVQSMLEEVCAVLRR